MTDPNNVIFKIAHADLYWRNPFNMLNLPVNATAKEIRRRREDIEAAFEAGTEAEEFRHVLPLDDGRLPPTLDAIQEAFATLDDLELRIAYSLFWFWPNPDTGKRDYERLFDEKGVIARWNTSAATLTDSSQRATITHNLAVFHHLMAMGYEQSLLTNVSWHGATPDDVRKEWESAIRYWNSAAADSEAWHLVADLISERNDPRLDHRFARSMRDQFAFAFDQINVELAIAFAKVGRDADARRQVEYMKLSQPDADDVEGTFDDAFAGLLHQVEAIVKTAGEETAKDPKSGLAKADEILERTKESVQVSRIVFDKGAPIRENIVTTIFAGVRNCMIAYGNKTTDWDGCLKRIPAIKALAENDRQVAIVAEDERIIGENKKIQDEDGVCCWCGTKKDVSCSSEVVVPMYGEVRHVGNQYNWKQVNVPIPTCKNCREKYRKWEDVKTMSPLYGWLATIVLGGVFNLIRQINGEFKGGPVGAIILGGFCGAALGIIVVCILSGIGDFLHSCVSSVPKEKLYVHPRVKSMGEKGYDIGDKPPQVK